MSSKRTRETISWGAKTKAKQTRVTAKKLASIPVDQNSWTDEAESFGVHRTHISMVPVLKSGSKVTPEQFLAFRTIWPPERPIDELEIPNREQAEKIVEEMDCFQEYYRHLREREDEPPTANLGVFQLVLESQQQIGNVLQSAAKPSSDSQSVLFEATSSERSREASVNSDHSAAGNHPNPHKLWEPTEDEQIVNDALGLFLRAVTINLRGAQCRWCVARLAFKVPFGTAHMEARTDGYLGYSGDTISGEAIAILEAKSRVRAKERRSEHSIYMQESAEMVGWIRKDQIKARVHRLPALGSGGRSRLLIAQDRHEIRVVIATYDRDYEGYLRSTDDVSSLPVSLMTMQEYGPFLVTSPTHMRHLARFTIGFCLQVGK